MGGDETEEPFCGSVLLYSTLLHTNPGYYEPIFLHSSLVHGTEEVVSASLT